MADTYNLSDVFISYSRKDSTFVRQLFESLKAENKEVWADFEDIPKAADWWKEIQAGIDAADSFLFVISPDSVRSDVCLQEVEHAVAKGKRFIPLLYRDVVEEDDKKKIHAAISAHNWIFFRDTDDYNTSFKTLLESINTDLEHNRMLKRLLVRAMEWDGAKRNPSYALRGQDLQQAQAWLSTALNKTPAPMALHIDYINFSLQQQRHQERQRMTLMTGGLAVSIVLTILALVSWFAANDARKDAELARDIAQVSEQKARSLGLAASAIQALVDYKPDLALQLALLATNTQNQPTQITASLAQVVYNPGTSRHIEVGTALNNVVYSPDGTRIAAAGLNGYVCLWEADTGDQQMCLATEDKNWQAYRVRRVMFDESGHRLMSVTLQGKLTLWNVDSSSPDVGKIIQEYTCPPLDTDTPCEIADAAMNGDASVVAFALRDGRVGVWNAVQNQFVRWMNTTDVYNTYEALNLPISKPVSVALSSSGYRALVGYETGIVYEWYLTTGNLLKAYPERPFYEEPPSTADITALAYSPNGLLAVAGNQDGRIFMWDPTDPLANQPTFDGHEGMVTSLMFHPDGHRFFSSSADNSIVEWDVDSGQDVREYFGHEGSVNTVAVSPLGDFIASGGYDAALRFWRTHTPIMLTEVHTQGLRTAAYNAKARVLAIGDDTGLISLYKEVDRDVMMGGRQFQGYGSYVQDLVLTDDGNSLIALYGDQSLVRRDVVSGKRIWHMTTSRAAPQTLLLLPDNKTLLVVFADGWAIYDWQTGTEQGWVTFSKKMIRQMAAHPNGEWIAIGINHLTENLFLVNWQTGEILRTYKGHRDGVTTVAFDQSGDRIVTGSFDTDVRVWDTNTGAALNVFSGHNDRVATVQFVPETNLVLSGSYDRSMRLWNLDTDFLMYRYQAHTGRVIDAFTKPDGKVLISAGTDGRIYFWMLPPRLPDMIAWAKANRYVRELTCAEANLYLGQDQDCAVVETTTEG